jgi:hypothetical protein
MVRARGSVRVLEDVYLLCGGGGACASVAGFASAIFTGAPGRVFMTPSTITLSPGLSPSLITPLIPGPVAHFDRTRLSHTLVVHDHDDLALRSFEHCALRDGQRIDILCTLERYPHELAGTQPLVAVGQDSTHFAGPSRGIDTHVGEVDLSGASCGAAIRQLYRDVETSIFGQAQTSRSGLGTELEILLIAETEIT